MPELTVVIASSNRGALLQESLLSILEQGVDLQIKVVRTPDDVEVPSVPATEDPRVEVIDGRDCERPSIGWTRGLDRADTPWSMTFDDDDLMFPGSLSCVLSLATAWDLEMIGALQWIAPADITRADIQNLTPEAVSAERPPTVVYWSWDKMAEMRIPGMGHVVWRSHLNRAVCGANQPPPGDSVFATTLFAASKRTAVCNVHLRAYRQHSGMFTVKRGPEWVKQAAQDYVDWATATFPEFAEARRRISPEAPPAQ